MNKYENLEVIELDSITDISDIIAKSFLGTGASMCLISDRTLVEYTMVELLKHDDITADEIFLFDSEEFPMYVGINKDYQIYVDDTEEKGHLDYDVAFIDMDGNVDQSIIDECLNNDIGVILFGEVDSFDYDEPVERDEDDSIHSICLNFEEEDSSYEFKFYSSNGIDKEAIIDILKNLKF